MLRARLTLVLLFVVCFSLATQLHLHPEWRQHQRQPSGEVLALLLGDTRKLFANQLFAKADAYFHRGKYPSIFDRDAKSGENHMSDEAQHHDEGEGHDDHADDAPPARDWIEAFGRHFHPTVHAHLKGSEQREMLPWLRLSTELDPQNIENFTTTAYWLSERLNRTDEAEQILREGLRSNPNEPHLLYELGRLCCKNHNDLPHAKNLWRFALRRCHEVMKPPLVVSDRLLLEEICGGLEKIAEVNGDFEEALDYLRQLKEVAPDPDAIQKLIDALAAKAGPQK